MSLNTLHEIAVSLKFKKYLLSCDIDSRNVVLQSCINALSDWDEMQKKCIDWLQNILDITSKPENERRIETRKDGRWDELHYELSKCVPFRQIMQMFVG